jgi:hypothetical protein
MKTILSIKRPLKVKGATSSVRFHSVATLGFLVRMDRSGLDGPRFLLLRTENLLPLDFSNHGQSSLKLTARDLPPGEYALSRRA